MRISERKLSQFFKKHQLIFVSVFLALYSLHLALTYQKGVPRGYVVREALSVVMNPVERMILGTRSAVVDAWTHYVFLVGLTRENAELKSRVIALQNENNRLKEDVSQNNRLRELLAYREAEPWHSAVAAIVAFNGSAWSRTVTIDKGASDGMSDERAVITQQGVVGRVIETGGRSSTILLATDVRSDIDVFDERSRFKGVIEGDGEDGFILKYIRLDDDVQAGDLILTSGIAGVFPKGLLVGTVVKVEKSRDNFFKHIEVRPSVNLATLEDVVVVMDTGFYSKE